MHLLPPLFALALAGAGPSTGPALSRYAFAERHMGTRFEIIVYAPDRAAARKATREAFARIAALDGIMSDYKPASELMRLCARAGGPPVKVSDELFYVLAKAQEVSRRSGGAFDVTVGPVVRLWRRARRTHRPPDAEALARARALVSYENVVLNDKARTVRLLKRGMLLDLGGIGKGYSADEALKVLKGHGITRALVAAGGDIAVGDPPPGKKGWSVAIASLEPGKTEPSRLLLANAAVSTSGDLEQYVEIDGKRYSHILDPRTGSPLVGRMSATVVAPKGILADSHTKVVAVLGPEKGFKVLERLGFQARYARKTEKGVEVKTTLGFAKLYAPGE
jgi:FAD:protein FMN transferase